MRGECPLEKHNKYMNSCSSIHDYSIKKENCQMTLLLFISHKKLRHLHMDAINNVLKILKPLINHCGIIKVIGNLRIYSYKNPYINCKLIFLIVLKGMKMHLHQVWFA